MKYRIRCIALVAVVLLWTPGCSAPLVENNTIEEIAPVIFWFIKEAENGQLSIGTMIPPLLKEERKRLLSMKVSLLRQGGEKFNLSYFREVRNGQLRMLLIDKQLAAKGIRPLVETILSDTEISQRLYLVITDGDVETYIRGQMEQQPDVDYYLYRMLKHYERKSQGDITVVNLHQYMKSSHSRFSDPILPVFKVDKDHFLYNGTALLKDDKLVDTLQGGQEQAMQLINNDHYLEYLPVPALGVSLGHVRSTVRMEPDKRLRTLTVKVSMRARVDEYRGAEDLMSRSGLTRLSGEIEGYLEKETRTLIQKIQQFKVDPLEIGKRTLSPFRNPMSDQQWMDAWEHMKIDVDYWIDLESVASPNG
jgi:spore germination protein